MAVENGKLRLAGAVQLRGGTAEVLESVNPLLYAREIMIETDTGKLKIGDGARNWNSLYYVSSSGTSAEFPPVDNKIYVIKNGEYVSVTPELYEVADMELIQDEEMTSYQFTGENIEVRL